MLLTQVFLLKSCYSHSREFFWMLVTSVTSKCFFILHVTHKNFFWRHVTGTPPHKCFLLNACYSQVFYCKWFNRNHVYQIPVGMLQTYFKRISSCTQCTLTLRTLSLACCTSSLSRLISLELTNRWTSISSIFLSEKSSTNGPPERKAQLILL